MGMRFFRLDTETYPFDATSSFHLDGSTTNTEWRCGDRAVSLERVQRVWYRRHRLPQYPTDMQRPHAEYSLRESDWYLRGVLLSLRTHTPQFWMNDPICVQQAESKILQLQEATRAGFSCPATLVSNDPAEIREFLGKRDSHFIAKALRLGYFDYGDRQTAAYTTSISATDIENDDELHIAPVIYQERIAKRFDIRVTVVNDIIFAAAIHSQSDDSSRIDWRRTAVDLEHSHHELPQDIQQQCMSLMRSLGLRYGAIDLVLTNGGDYIFLEVNASGQWLWLEDRLSFPITAAVATWLGSAAP